MLYQRCIILFLASLVIFRVVVVSNEPTSIHRDEWQFPQWVGLKHDGRSVVPPAVSLMPIVKAALEGNNDIVFHRVYMVMDGVLWMAQVPHAQSEMIRDRARFSEGILARAVKHRTTPLLFVINYADSTVCEPRWPILTMSAPISCDAAFPFPNYETIIRARKKVQFAYWGTYLWWKYPWKSRHRKAVWRGSPTGIGINSIPRVELCRWAEQYPDLLDAKLVGSEQTFPILNTLSPSLMGERMAVRDFQNYHAVVDIDGNSWSSRFGMLLCYSSVVLKVQPEYVDYFYSELIPNVHYIPVSADFHDLLDKIRFATADENAPTIQRIIRNANLWCAKRMQLNVIERDMEWILDRYDSVTTLVTDQDVTSLLELYEFRKIDPD